MLLLRTTAPVFDAHCYVIAAAEGGDALVVDPGAGAADGVAELLERYRLGVGAVVLTHAHADHVWDAAAVAGPAPVYVAAPDLYRLDDPAAALGEPLATTFLQLAGTPWRRPETVVPLPSATLAGGGGLLVPGVVVRALPAPGHTEGSTVLLVRGEVDAPRLLPADVAPDDDGTHLLALCGDVVFARSVGRTDLPGGDEREMSATLRTLVRALPPTTVLLPGHGAVSLLSRERTTNPYLRDVLGR
ncbi:MBL fold metallo-hydrolase [Georgenia sp. SYP-B2076]|uniref:MBL fold metallo-hydrolase n=1 Tax=Georgenia sp. SYP-B2076 TaxID=2495881 RepID=UPI000F8F140A|nr:MBL fold metallo-hydrolase [Georgenia sp. SYP-B2076]